MKELEDEVVKKVLVSKPQRKMNFKTFPEIKAELEYEWKFHKGSSFYLLYGVGFFVLAMATGALSMRLNVLVDPVLTQFLALTALGGVTYLVFNEQAKILRKTEEKRCGNDGD